MTKKAKKPNIKTYLAKHKLGIAAYIITVILVGVCGIFNTLLLARGIEFLTLDEFQKVTWILLLALASAVLRVGFTYINTIIYAKVTCKMISELNLDLAKQAFKLNSKTYNDHDTGTFVQRIVADPERLVDGMTNVVDIVVDLLMQTIMIIYIMTINFYISLVLIATILIGLGIEFWRVKVRRKNRKDMRKKSDKINSLTTEIVRSEQDIKSIGLEEKLSEVSKQNYDAYNKSRYKFGMVDTNFWSMRNLVANVGSILVLVLGVHLMRLDLITLGSFMIVYSNNRSANFIWQLGSIANLFVDMRVAHERMFSIFDENEFMTEKFGSKQIEKTKGKIQFKKVCFAYREYEYIRNKKDKTTTKKLVSQNKILDNLSFTINPHTTVAFVGKSGSGKSTILNLISKMYEADSGKVLIDGIDVKDLSKQSLRSTISLVNQFPYIFDMSIKENLLLAKSSATEDEIISALKNASIYDEFVVTLPNGINTRVGEGGIKLSGGQKQRLAIARALLRNSSIIIFDESTSSLDNFAQNAIKKTIDSLKGTSTIVIVAHRLSTIKDVDEIFFLDEGKIVDKGTFDELFARNEKFRAMFLAENI